MIYIISQLVAFSFHLEYICHIFFYFTVAVHCSSSHIGRINKRYYDAWEMKNDAENNNEGESVKPNSLRYKGLHKEGPCENKPLWFLKSQRKLGKLSPFYDCLNGLE